MKGIITTFITLSVAMCGAKSVFHRPLGAAIPLILGQCEAGHVDSQEWTMYSLNVTRTTLHDGQVRSICLHIAAHFTEVRQIIVVPLAGDPDLYARVGAEPTLSNHDYKSLSLSGNESISFFKNDTPLVERCITQCVLYIGVHGFQVREPRSSVANCRITDKLKETDYSILAILHESRPDVVELELADAWSAGQQQANRVPVLQGQGIHRIEFHGTLV